MTRPRVPTSWIHLPRRTVRMRLTLLYGGLFLASGAVLLVIANVGVRSSAQVAVPAGRGGLSAPSIPIAVAQHGNDVHQLGIFSVVALAIMAALSLGLGWLVAGRLLRPLRTITTTAREISASNLHERLNLDGPDDEFKELGQTLDDLFARLQASFESQKHFVANASHELRTPLTAERTLLQVTLADPGASAQTLRSTCEELLTLGHQQERLIDALLTLASSERGIEQWRAFDLAEIAGEVVAVRRPEAERQRIRVDTTLTAAPATGDPRLVESLVANLVDNALRHNVAGGRIGISTTTEALGPTITVQNTGQIIPPDQVDRLFQPFQRMGTERTSTDGQGLGLAIVAAIATAHGAVLSVHAPPDGGLHVEVRFPVGGPRPGQPAAAADAENRR